MGRAIRGGTSFEQSRLYSTQLLTHTSDLGPPAAAIPFRLLGGFSLDTDVKATFTKGSTALCPAARRAGAAHGGKERREFLVWSYDAGTEEPLLTMVP